MPVARDLNAQSGEGHLPSAVYYGMARDVQRTGVMLVAKVLALFRPHPLFIGEAACLADVKDFTLIHQFSHHTGNPLSHLLGIYFLK
jgi:hypothetical protein